MFKKDVIEYECVVTPIQLNDKIDTIMLTKAKEQLVDKCSGYGFIKQIFRILKRSEGLITNDGNIIYTLFLEVLICNPEVGEEMECEITDQEERIGKPMMKKDPLFVVLFSKDDTTYEIGEKVFGVITDKRIDKRNNIINLLVDVI